MMNLTQHLDSMRHALGKTPNSKHRLIDSFNQAGRALFMHHNWSWKSRGPELLPIPAGVERVELPDDFGQLIHVDVANSTVFAVKPVSLSTIMRMRSSAGYEAQVLYMAFLTGRGQATTTSEGNSPKVAELWPTPGEARSNVYITYRAEWIDLEETPNANDVPNIPAEWERALMLWARKNAVEIENQEQPAEGGALQDELERLIRYDAGIQPDMGRPTTRVRRGGEGSRRPHGLIGPY